MTDYRSWQYDELKQVGKDYGDPSEVEVYDSRHAQFRDVEKDNATILNSLNIETDHVLIDFGAGTGALAIQAGRRCAKVFAVDVSQAMLDYSRVKATDAGVANIEFHQGGFLTYSHGGDQVDAIVTCAAFHHLPDFWKSIALRRMNEMLKLDGKLYISDVIFGEHNALQNISQWIEKLAAAGGETLREDVETHIREEYSTFEWIMDGLLTRAGFRIETKNMHEGVVGNYLCTKESECAQEPISSD
jgi:putative AdoMet-dependent methyltransferase